MEKKKKDDEEVAEWVGGHKVYPGEKEKIDKEDWLNKPDEYYGFGKASNRRVDKDVREDKE